MADVLQMSVRCDEFAPGAVRTQMQSLPGLGWVLGDAMLVASELVTNAVRHSLCTEDELLRVLVTRDGRLRISVLDPGASGRSAEIADRPIDLGGLGLKVVEQLSSMWGTERRDDGYQVWAELEIPH
ncbi:MAG TPA: ATP-binding protein [Solirubrobacteraceae bacterium]|nr:ATP-binding protein [Solirubrobacteraceae bacterium]